MGSLSTHVCWRVERVSFTQFRISQELVSVKTVQVTVACRDVL